MKILDCSGGLEDLNNHKKADGLMVIVDRIKTRPTSASLNVKEMGIGKGQVSKMSKKAIDTGLLIKFGGGYGIP